ncbi:MAG: chorismate mutase, partial [Eubacteriales bacterium]
MELSELRDQINQIDDEMLELFLRRMDVSEAIAAYKKAHGLP